MKFANWARSAASRPELRAPHSRREAGAAAVEFALVLPILLTLVFGMIDFGYIFASQISLNSSARDAARAGVVKYGTSALTCSQIAHKARGGAMTIGLSVPTAIGVDVKLSGASTICAALATAIDPTDTTQVCAGSSNTAQLVVTLTYPVQLPLPLPLASPTLTATGAFQCEYS